MEKYFYYGFAAVMGAILALLVVVCFLYHMDRPIGAVGALVVSILVVFDMLRTEFRIVNNQRAKWYTITMFGSGLATTLTSLTILG